MKNLNRSFVGRSDRRAAVLGSTAPFAAFFIFIIIVIGSNTHTHAAGKPGGGGGGGNCQPRVTFDNSPDDSLRSDTGAPYCHAPKQNVTVSFSPDGHLQLDTNSSTKPGAGRGLYVDFGEPISVEDSEGKILKTFQTTAELDLAGINHDAHFAIGGWQNDFNMLTMKVGDVHYNVNLMLGMAFTFPDGQGAGIFVKMAPNILDNGRQCEISDSVAVMCIGVDSAGNANTWRIETQEPGNEACVSQEPFGHDLDDLTIGVRRLSFGLTVNR